jgi:uncharacterized integral membrane protein
MSSRDDELRRNDNPAAGGRSGPNLTLIAFAAVVMLSVIFFLQNGEETSIDFWVFESTTTIRWSLLMAVVLGIVLDRLFSMWWRRRRRRKD